MKIKDIIKKLQELDPEAEGIITSANFELNGATVPVSSIHQYKTGSVKTQKFRDAFDGDYYNKEVYSIVGGKNKVVYISWFIWK